MFDVTSFSVGQWPLHIVTRSAHPILMLPVTGAKADTGRRVRDAFPASQLNTEVGRVSTNCTPVKVPSEYSRKSNNYDIKT